MSNLLIGLLVLLALGSKELFDLIGVLLGGAVALFIANVGLRALCR